MACQFIQVLNQKFPVDAVSVGSVTMENSLLLKIVCYKRFCTI